MLVELDVELIEEEHARKVHVRLSHVMASQVRFWPEGRVEEVLAARGVARVAKRARKRAKLAERAGSAHG